MNHNHISAHLSNLFVELVCRTYLSNILTTPKAIRQSLHQTVAAQAQGCLDNQDS